jgi:hypothetical protein
MKCEKSKYLSNFLNGSFIGEMGSGGVWSGIVGWCWWTDGLGKKMTPTAHWLMDEEESERRRLLVGWVMRWK